MSKIAFVGQFVDGATNIDKIKCYLGKIIKPEMRAPKSDYNLKTFSYIVSTYVSNCIE